MTQTAWIREAPQRRPAGSIEEARQALADALSSAPSTPLFRFSWSVEPAPITRLWAAFPERDAVLFAPPRGHALAGVGVARVLRASGDSRFASVAQQSDSLLASVAPIGALAPRLDGPWLVGGAAFRSGSNAPEWERFGDACFVLPRLAYGEQGGRAALSLIASPDEGVDRLLAELAAGLEALRAAPAATPLPQVKGVAHLGRDRYTEELLAIREAIAGGRVDKAVLTRRSTLRLSADADAAALLDALGARHPSCTRFALRLDGVTFLGATPERLVQRQGDEVRSEALAGTASPGHGDELMRSQKESGEHGFVVAAIESALRPLVRELSHDPEPRLRRLRDVLHLETRFRGRLAEPRHVLRLVQALHPTPAVGGTPTAAALELLREVEAEPRGFYSGPFGAFDARGDGTFVVALRSALLDADSAYVYAGGGIVEGSEPEAEYAESELKMRAILGAFGAG